MSVCRQKLVKVAKAEVHKINVSYLKEWYNSCGNFHHTSMPICLISKLSHVADLTNLMHVQVTICLRIQEMCTQRAWSSTFIQAQVQFKIKKIKIKQKNKTFIAASGDQPFKWWFIKFPFSFMGPTIFPFHLTMLGFCVPWQIFDSLLSSVCALQSLHSVTYY